MRCQSKNSKWDQDNKGRVTRSRSATEFAQCWAIGV